MGVRLALLHADFSRQGARVARVAEDGSLADMSLQQPPSLASLASLAAKNPGHWGGLPVVHRPQPCRPCPRTYFATMGFSGQLGTVNLADIFQTLQMNRQSGTMTVTGPAEVVRIWFSDGQIVLCSAPPIDGRPFILHAVLKKGLVQLDIGEDLQRRHRQTGQPMRELLLHAGAMVETDLDEVSAWCIEEQVCPIFEWSSGEFSFEEGPPVAELQTSDIVQMGDTGLQTTQVVMEATRRKDEWRRIRDVITDPDALFLVDHDGRANLRNLQTDPEMLKVLRYLDGQHALEAIAQAVGLTRFDTYAIVAQLVVAGVARARGVAEIVDDALQLKAGGEAQRARDLLENAARSAPVAEVLKPLAEVCAELGQVPRAVELYLTLIQQAQDAGDLQLALTYLDTVIGLSPDDPDLQFERAQVHAELGNVEPAAQGFSAAAQAYLATKAVQKAIDACHRAKNILPRSPDPHRFLARAYLLDGNTETAVVEYKSLWHALLTVHRPRKALEELTTILDADCKYAAVKEQVLSHAKNSEAVKTSTAIRTLVYVAMGCVIAAGLIAGWWFYEGHLLKQEGLKHVTSIEGSLPERYKAVEHIQVRELIATLRAEYGVRVPEVEDRLIVLDTEVMKDFERRAEARLAVVVELLKGGRFADARAAIVDLTTRYEGTAAAKRAAEVREQITREETNIAVDGPVARAQLMWAAWDWDGALAELGPVLARSDLPVERRKDLSTCQVEWQAALRSAKSLSERAAAIQASGDMPGALAAWRRASDPGADGDGDRASALNRLVALEREFADGLARQAQGAAARGDAAACFTALDRLAALGKDARGSGPKEVAAALTVPFTIDIDSRFAVLSIARAGQAAETVRAPDGTTGAWRHVVPWRVVDVLTVTASRIGFAPQTFSITAAARRTGAPVALVRGPRWRAELGAAPASAPVSIPGAILVGSNRATLEMVDPLQGVSRPISFPDSVAELSAVPVVFGGRGYLVLDDRINAVDLAARSRLWSWPGNTDNRLRLTGHIAVHEHDLIQGQLMIYAAAARGEVICLAVDTSGKVQRYPGLQLPGEVTGQMVTDRVDPTHTILYVPAAQGLHAFDLTAVTERNAATPLFSVRTRGDLIGTPVPVTVQGTPCLLISDASGLVVAIDRRTGTPDSKRIVASWAVDGSSPSTPTLTPKGDFAFIATPEGRVQCLDLGHPGQVRWRAPAKGAGLGVLIGSPALGKRGLYVADGNGLLHCLDVVNGELRWKADIGGSAVGGAIAVDGRILVPTRNGQLVCFEEGEE
jgi:outer membrane protein assembly factor BamB/tetratricopeptide (TPR) repeat protein